MKVLIADKLSETVTTALQQLGLQVESRPDLTAEQIPGVLGDTNILVVRSTRVTAAAMQAGRELALVIRAGAGFNTIDLPSASARGIYVANCPGKNTAAVAELAIGLLISADRQIVAATTALRRGVWQKQRFAAAGGLRGRTLGILGFGAIGQAVAERARGLGMNVLVWSRSLTADVARQHGVECADSMMSIAQNSDAVSVHLALCDDTRHLLAEEFFSGMRPGAILVNTSRGELVDSEALRAAIESKQLRVGLDVFEDEPVGGEAEFAQTELANQVICTPHIGASTQEASEAIAAEVVRIVDVYVRTGRPPAAVNICDRSPATHHLVVRHLNRVGVLAGILDGLRAEGINVEEMDNIIFDGAEAACCTLLLDQSPSANLMAELREQPEVLSALLEANE